ncbi:hypothetical protein QQF73_15990 [Marinobacter sp. M216]|uniref:Antibiotic biosynthesis monooxygenase n=1 Tax=Marinobacter albus TaxID=3030833 RepID=A0ABT7HHY4_9GAMM|nr:hypothetical protein [Marinobacter sp. M216]MDK9559135.1 hypothetical protein [Marinobacter sp. M216]
MKKETPIVRLFFAKMKPAFFQLSEEEQRQFMVRDRANLDALGMKAISMIDCTISDSEWDYIGVERWPSVKALEEREKFETDELHISQYVDYKVEFGAEQSFEEYGKPQ